MTTPILAPSEGRTLLVGESVLSGASAVWWTYLLWAHRNVLYAVPAAVTLILTVVLSLLVTWVLWHRAGKLKGVNLALVAVRGVAVLALTLWFLQDL
ncbi:hypothetical protein [Streptomyces hokutonensis]|uniref:hypothetical protein n=1 Tax=Streptomyces hokutonensis TaxID=1306990 RepID=UPI0007C54ECA|nr:hypothetical protein [Streptomyces hokutonensis]